MARLPDWFPPGPWESLHVALELAGAGRGGARRRRVLVLGGVDADLAVALRVAGVHRTDAPDAASALRLVQGEAFDAVVVDTEGDGAFDFVRAVKGPAPAGPAGQPDLVVRLRRLPLFVLPVAGETEYAVLLEPPQLVWLERAEVLPIAKAICRLDVDRLLAAAGRRPPPRWN